MNMESISVRRATLEDIGALVEIWRLMRFETEALAKRVTEFQVAALPDGSVIGAVGLQILEKQGCIHSEGYTDFAFAEAARGPLWDRLNAVANNYGLVRLWTREQAPFWHHCGMSQPDREAFERMPAVWRGAAAQSQWLTLKLRDDLNTLTHVDKDFMLFMQAEKAKTEKAMQRAKMLKAMAAVVALLVMGVVIAAAFYVVQRSGLLRRYRR